MLQLLKVYSGRKVAEILNINRNTINRIKREGFLKCDKIALRIHSIKERKPNLTLKGIQRFYLKKYNKLISVETIRKKLLNYGIYGHRVDEELENFLNYLIENNYYNEAKQLLKLYKPSNLDILKKLPEKFIPLYLIPEKLRLEARVGNYEVTLSKTEKYVKIALKRKFMLTYYRLISLKISLLIYLHRDNEAYNIYLFLKDILKFPKDIKISILWRAMFLDLANAKISKSILNILKKYIDDEEIKEAVVKTLRNLGYINQAKQIDENHFYDYFCNFDFKNFFKFSNYKFKDPENALVYKILKFIAIIMSHRELENLYRLKNEIEQEFKRRGLKFYEGLYYFAMGLFHMYHGETKEAREFLEKSIKSGKIIVYEDIEKLSKFRKQDLVLKYLMKGNIKLAVEIARRYGIIHALNTYALLLKKPYHRIKKYKELKWIARLIRKQNTIKAYFLRNYPVIYVNKKKYKIYRFSKSWIMLAYLILKKGRAKIDEIYWIKNIKQAIYFINKKFKTTLLSIYKDEVKINGEFESDIEKFSSEKSKKKALILWQSEPFRRISYFYNWAEDIRDTCKMKREELLSK